MRGLALDARGALYRLVRDPVYAALWAGILALTLGVAAAVFGLVDAVLLRPLPFPHADRLVRINTAFPTSGLENLSLSADEFVDLQTRSHAFASMGGFIPDSYTLLGENEAARLTGAWVTPGFFATLGVTPDLGRVPSPRDRAPGAEPLVVLSNRVWRVRFGADPAIIGRTLTLDGRARRVVGVMPEGFDYPPEAEIWTSLRFTQGMLTPGERGDRYLRVVGRMRPGLRPAALQRDLRSLVPAFRREHATFYTDTAFALTAVGLRQDLLGDVRPALLALLAGVALLLLVAVANLANVSLVRATTRSREMAVRASLGASRGRLLRQLMLENLTLAFLGGAAGASLGWWGVSALARLAPADLPRLAATRPDLRVLAFGFGLALITGVSAGAVPAILGGARRLGSSLALGGPRTGEPRGRGRARDTLVAGQVAVTLVLLIAAGLVVRSLVHLRDVDPGLDPSRTLTARVGLPSAAYTEPQQVRGFYDHLLGDLRALPGVRSAGATAILPLDGGAWEVSFTVEGHQRAEGAPEPSLQYRPVTPGFFGTLRVPLLQGRLLQESNDADAPRVAVVNEAFARRYLRDGRVLGARIRLPRLGQEGEDHVRTVVGVVGDVRQSLAAEAPPVLYVPHAQQPERTMTLVLRSEGPPGDLTAAVRARLAALDPTLPLYEVRTMREVLGAGLARHRFVVFLLSLFSTAGLILACLGVWATVSYAVARRTREVGIRIALGATPRGVLAAVAARGSAPVLVGAGAGVLASIPATRFVGGLMYGVSTHDAGTTVLAVGIVVTVGAVASWLPARRAASVDPAAALREE